MSAHAQSRRAFILAGSAIASTGGVALAGTATSPDPVFALIEAEQVAWKAFHDAIDALDVAEIAFRESGFDRKPRVQVGTYTSFVDSDHNPLPVSEYRPKPIYLHSHEAVDRDYDGRKRAVFADRCGIEASPGSLAEIEELRTRAHQRLDDDAAAIEAANVRCGVPAAQLAERETDAAARAAEEAVYAVNPTTIAGLLAVMALFEEREFQNVSFPLDGFLFDLFASVRALVGAAS